MSGLPWWLTWGQFAWTADDATVARAVWLTLAFYVWGAVVVVFIIDLILDDEPGRNSLPIIFAGAIAGVMWPLVAGGALVVAAVAAIVVPARAQVHGRKRRQRARAEAVKRQRQDLTELEASALAPLDIAQLERRPL